MIRRPPRSTRKESSAASDVYKRQGLIDDEGIVYAEIDLNRCIQPKQMHDILGHYNRFDIFDLRVNRTVQTPLTFVNEVYSEDSYNQSLKTSRNEDD